MRSRAVQIEARDVESRITVDGLTVSVRYDPSVVTHRGSPSQQRLYEGLGSAHQPVAS